MPYCKNCGNQLTDTDNFCSNCGEYFGVHNSNSDSEETYNLDNMVNHLNSITETNTIPKCDDGVYYIGEFKGNLRHGKGCSYHAYFPSVKLYEGDWENNVQSGYGILYNCFGYKTFEGSYKNDLKNGFGKIFSPFSNQIDKYFLWYEGGFVDDRIEGKGVFYSEDGQIIYEGELIDGNPHGVGKLIGTWDNKFGECEFDLMDVLNVGDIYIGEFNEGNITGKGKLIKLNGNIYEGEFENGLLKGLGTQRKDGAGIR